MLYSIVFEDYSKLLNTGIEKLNSYKSGMIKLGFTLITLSIILGVYTWLNVLKDIPIGTLVDFESFKISISTGNNLYFAIGTVVLFISSIISFLSHKKFVAKKMNAYIDQIHPKIIKMHKSIFEDHSKEAIKAFREERDEKKLLNILKVYKEHMDFIYNNYSNFNRDGTID